MMAELLLSPEEFKSSLIELQTRLNGCHGYTWHFHQFDLNDSATSEIYTKLPTQIVKEISNSHSNCSDQAEKAESLVVSKSLVQDELECPTKKGNKADYDAVMEYRVGFSQSFEVPVLYMRGQTSCGSQLGLQEVWNIFMSATGVDNKQVLWEAVTQIEHPYLHLPYFRIHPCKTGQLMNKLEVTKSNYLLLWLSVCGPMIGLQLPITTALSADIS